MEYAQNRYEKLKEDREVDLWDILAEYDFIMQQPKCIQMFLYDMISDQFAHHGEYSVLKAVNGDLYVRRINTFKMN